jgi:hypothetical protein
MLNCMFSFYLLSNIIDIVKLIVYIQLSYILINIFLKVVELFFVCIHIFFFACHFLDFEYVISLKSYH